MNSGVSRLQRIATLANSGSLFGVVYVLLGLLAFAIQDSIVKQLTADYPVLELLTLRSIVVQLGLIIIILVVSRKGAVGPTGRSLFHSSKPFLLLLRGTFAFFAFTVYYLALSRMPIADAAAIYMTAPLFVTALSVPFLKEKVGLHRAAAVIVGFVAAIAMIRPGSSVFQVVAVLPLFSAITYAFIPIVNRKVGMSQPALTMAFYTITSYLFLCLVSYFLVHFFSWQIDPENVFANLTEHWRPMSFVHLFWTIVSGLFFICGLLGLTQSYRLLPVSIVAPFEYSYLIWATLLGFLVFGEFPGPHTLLGGLVIVLCGCYITYREHGVGRGTADS